MRKVIESEELKKKYRTKPVYFTRNRKQPFVELLVFMMNFLQKSLQMEIINFHKVLSDLKGLPKRIITFSKSAFVQNRQKISPEIFKHLLNVFNNEFYTNNELNVKLWNGYRLLATDGSLITLPITDELKEKYGELRNQHETSLVSARCSIMYDIENKMVLDGILSPKKTGERALALRHLQYCTVNDLIIYDRGYPSFDFIYEHEQLHLNYIIRVKTSWSEVIKKFVHFGENSELAELKPGKNSSLKDKAYDKNSKQLIRLVKVELDNGEVEVLITSLKDHEQYPDNIFKDLYFKRWGVETYYDVLKNKLQLENFSGYSDISIQQDFNVLLFLSNLQSLIVKEVDEDISEKYSERKFEYQVNNNLSLGFMKNRIIELFLCEEPENILEELKNLFIEHVEPKRPGRKNKREVDKYRTRKKPIILKNYKNVF